VFLLCVRAPPPATPTTKHNRQHQHQLSCMHIMFHESNCMLKRTRVGFINRPSKIRTSAIIAAMPVGNPELGHEGDANPHIYHLIASETLTIIEQGSCPMCGHPRVDQYVVEIYRHIWGFTFHVMIGHPGAMGEPSGCYYSSPVYVTQPRGEYTRGILRLRSGTMTYAQPPAPPPPPPPPPPPQHVVTVPIVDDTPTVDGHPFGFEM
jgi:hypothetical protein